MKFLHHHKVYVAKRLLSSQLQEQGIDALIYSIQTEVQQEQELKDREDEYFSKLQQSKLALKEPEAKPEGSSRPKGSVHTRRKSTFSPIIEGCILSSVRD